MRKIQTLSSWAQQNFEIALLLILNGFLLIRELAGIQVAGQFLLMAISANSAMILHAKVMSRRPSRIPATEKIWLSLFTSASGGLILSAVWPFISAWSLLVVLPLTMGAVLYERKSRYESAKIRILKRREQQARWRLAKKAVLSDWKERLRWLAGVQHDMRQPLHALGLLVGHPSLNGNSAHGGHSKADQVLRQMMSCQRWLHELAENTMEATRLELGEPREQKVEAVSSLELCSSLASWMGQLAESKGLVLYSEFDDAVIQTDIRRLKRVVGNLLFNAVEHTFEGKVTFTYKRQGGVHVFRITDTGPGVDEAIFKDQARSEVFTSDLPKSGLGLYVVKKLCEEMNWNLSLTKSPLDGTTFTLELADRIMTRTARSPNASVEHTV